jgi:hypothetical protein
VRPDQYIQVNQMLVMMRQLPNGDVTTLVFNASTGEFDVDLSFLPDFHFSKNNPEYLTKEELFRRVAMQKVARSYTVVPD